MKCVTRPGVVLALTLSWTAVVPPAAAAGGRSPDEIWHASEQRPDEPGDVVLAEGAYALYDLDAASLRDQLAGLPLEQVGEPAGGEPISLPLPDGGFARLVAVESPVMDEALAQQYPDMKTYSARGVDDPSLTARFSYGPNGFNAILLFPERTVYVAPYRSDDAVLYAAYDRDGVLSEEPRPCHVDGRELPEGLSPADLGPGRLDHGLRNGPARAPVAAPNSGTLRVYRLALASAAEFSNSVGNVPGPSMVTTVAFVNAIFDRDTAVRLVLVSTPVFFNPVTDPYSVGSKALMLAENQGALDSLVGAGAYDIGHVFSGGPDGGMGFPFTCTTLKAFGVSGGRGGAGGGVFPGFVEHVAHEMGHQMGATHTFNGTRGSCGDPLQRWDASAVEPGSGSTLMSYAGTCLNENIAARADRYFHGKTLEQIIDFTVGPIGGACPAVFGTPNRGPVIAPLPDYVIPRDTPFKLRTFAVDPDEGTGVTLTFEQVDLSWPLGAGEPLFRSRPPSRIGERIFPRMADVLSGHRVFGELLPLSDRAMNFRITARDNQVPGGNVAWDEVRVTAEGPPFRVLYPNTWGLRWAPGTPETVTWTPNALASGVNILLSTDGGVTWIPLAGNVPNNGSHTIVVPQVTSLFCRIKVEAADNIFFDVSDGDVSIVMPPPTPILEGEHTGSTCLSTTGWAWDRANPTHTGYVDIFEDTGSALVPRSLSYPAWDSSPGQGNGNSAFNWRMPRSLKDGRARVFRVRQAGTSVDLVTSPRATPVCDLVGRFDSLSCTEILGWAADPDSPTDALAVDLILTNTSTGSKTTIPGWVANLHRAGLPGNGNHEFRVGVGLTGTFSVQVRHSDTKRALPGSPRTITCP